LASSFGATGTQPLSYKWRRNNITIINQTNALLRITNAASANAGNYTVIITNVAGAVTSAVRWSFTRLIMIVTAWRTMGTPL
jgi:hypothetical protein